MQNWIKYSYEKIAIVFSTLKKKNKLSTYPLTSTFYKQLRHCHLRAYATWIYNPHLPHTYVQIRWTSKVTVRTIMCNGSYYWNYNRRKALAMKNKKNFGIIWAAFFCCRFDLVKYFFRAQCCNWAKASVELMIFTITNLT